METSNLQWHPAFYAALQIDLKDEDVPLQFSSEFNLTQKPLQIDVLVIKKESDKSLKKNFVKLFRGHNIVEYKCEKDYFSVNDFYKVIAYTCLYQANTEHILEINPNDITITLVCCKFPRKLIKHLKKRYHITIKNPYIGVYYISGIMFPLQIWMIGKLSREEALWINSLRSGLDIKTELAELEHDYRGKEHIPNYATAMDVIVRANQSIMEGDESMCQALREMFAEDFKQHTERGRKEGQIIKTVTLTCRKLCKNKSPEQIADELDESLSDIIRICDIAKKYSPAYDTEKICQELLDYIT